MGGGLLSSGFLVVVWSGLWGGVEIFGTGLESLVQGFPGRAILTL